MGHLCVSRGLAPRSGLPSEPLWGCLGARKRPHAQARRPWFTFARLSLRPCPSPPATLGHLTSGLPRSLPLCWSPTVVPRPGVELGGPCPSPASSPPVSRDAWRAFPLPAVPSLQAFPFPEPWLPAGFCGFFLFLYSTPPGILCRRPSRGWLPTLQGSAAPSPPQGGPPLPSPPPLAVPASSLIFSVKCITEWPVVFLWCVRCGLWWPLEDRPRLSKPGARTGVWCGPAQQ